MKIYLGGDHAGFELKAKIFNHLKDGGYEVEDLGPHEYMEDDDYPDFVKLVAERISGNKEDLGIIFGKSGQGEAMVANRFKGVRAIVYYGKELEIIRLGREHNNANVLSLGAHFMDEEEAIFAVDLWLSTAFSGEEKHLRRINKLESL